MYSVPMKARPAEMEWRPANPADLAAIDRIANAVHAGLPERPEVFAEKLARFPAGCFVLKKGRRVVGYAISHPGRRGDIPALDTPLGAPPGDADCLHVHDIALLPEARGSGHPAAVLAELERLARGRGFRTMAMVSVYDTHPLWQRLGFQVVRDPPIARQLGSYGPTARYMVKSL